MVGSSGSSRSAGCCLSTAADRPEHLLRGQERARPVPGRSATRSCWPRSAGCMRTTTGSMGPARCGASCSREGIEVARCTVERLMRRRATRRGPRRQDPDHQPGPGRGPPGGPGRAAVRRAAAQPVVGRRLHLRRDLGRVRLRGVLHRRLLPDDHRLAGSQLDDHRPGPRRLGDGHLAAAPRRATRSRAWSTTPTPAPSTPRSATPSGLPRPALDPRSARSATPTRLPLLAAAGIDPVVKLLSVVDARELDSAVDRAAVLGWRLHDEGSPDAGSGPCRDYPPFPKAPPTRNVGRLFGRPSSHRRGAG